MMHILQLTTSFDKFSCVGISIISKQKSFVTGGAKMEKLNVAIADDNERMLRLLGDIIESDDELNVVGVARDGEEAYHVIKAKKEPDVVLLDIVMPKLDGLGVLDRVSRDTSIKNIRRLL